MRRWPSRVLQAFAFLLVLGLIALVVAPIFKRTDTLGIHDWDQMEAHRYLAVKTIKRFHQFPFWDPYSCGGHTWWGGVESGTTIVSPWLPTYLMLSLPWGLRVEVVGMALFGAVGAWLLASRFTKSAGLRLFVVAAYAVNSRWAAQASMGHTWHLYYAWVAWALFFLDRALELRATDGTPNPRSRFRNVVLLGATLALMVYTGAIYPLPQTVIILGIYAAVCARASRSWRPLGILAASGFISLGLAAPRLLPLMDSLRRYPRLVDSPESMDLSAFIGVFTTREGDPRPTLGPWGWHEFGIYTGMVPFLLMLCAPFLVRHARERALASAGVVCVLLGFGRFHKYAPWALFHDHLPIFESQHVPSRWLYPALLVLLVAMAGVIERFLARQPRRLLLDVALVSIGACVALDVGLEAQHPLVNAFTRNVPKVEESLGPFHQDKSAPPELRYSEGDWAPPALPAMMNNTGVIDCGTFPGLHLQLHDRTGHVTGIGARGRTEHDYHGEVWTTGDGHAAIESWTPNRVAVHYYGVSPGDVVALNQNWDPGWHASGGDVVPWRDVVAARVSSASGTVEFRYRPTFLLVGLAVLLMTLASIFLYARSERR